MAVRYQLSSSLRPCGGLAHGMISVQGPPRVNRPRWTWITGAASIRRRPPDSNFGTRDCGGSRRGMLLGLALLGISFPVGTRPPGAVPLWVDTIGADRRRSFCLQASSSPAPPMAGLAGGEFRYAGPMLLGWGALTVFGASAATGAWVACSHRGADPHDVSRRWPHCLSAGTSDSPRLWSMIPGVFLFSGLAERASAKLAEGRIGTFGVN